MTAADVRHRLDLLMAERLDAADAGLDRNASYMNDLAQDVAVCHVAYVTLAVTEIACLGAEFDGPLNG